MGVVRQAVWMDDERAGGLGGIGIEEQRDRLQGAFVHGWVSPARGPVTFTEDELARLDQVSQHGGWLYKHEQEHLRRLRAGGRRGDPLPAAPASREPFIDGTGEDFEVQIATTAQQTNVVVLFSHERWPGIRFGHRFPPPDRADGYERIWLKEEIETGALDRMMKGDPTPDSDGVIWTDWAHR
jgi:hypothetical protein